MITPHTPPLPSPPSYTHSTPQGLEALLAAVGHLSTAHQQRNSRLLIKQGPWEEVVGQVVEEYGAVEVITEDEVEHRSVVVCWVVMCVCVLGCDVEKEILVWC